MTKHTPATPLPWISADCYVEAKAALAGRGIAGVGVIAETRNEDSPQADDANASYIAHAANAYPKLVEALRAVLAKDGHGLRTTGELPARALLRELGEE
jgi:hypothetical protein